MGHITLRELPPPEWYRLIGHPAMQGAEVPGPDDPRSDNMRIVVAEDADGTIIGAVAAVTLVFMEGFYVAPDHRGSTVGPRLFSHLSTLLTSLGVPVLHTWTTSPDLASLTERLGFIPLPVVTLQKPLPCPQPLPSPPSLQSAPPPSPVAQAI